MENKKNEKIMEKQKKPSNFNAIGNLCMLIGMNIFILMILINLWYWFFTIPITLMCLTLIALCFTAALDCKIYHHYFQKRRVTWRGQDYDT